MKVESFPSCIEMYLEMSSAKYCSFYRIVNISVKTTPIVVRFLNIYKYITILCQEIIHQVHSICFEHPNIFQFCLVLVFCKCFCVSFEHMNGAGNNIIDSYAIRVQPKFRKTLFTQINHFRLTENIAVFGKHIITRAMGMWHSPAFAWHNSTPLLVCVTSHRRHILISIGVDLINLILRLSSDSLRFIMGIYVLVRRRLLWMEVPPPISIHGVCLRLQNVHGKATYFLSVRRFDEFIIWNPRSTQRIVNNSLWSMSMT